MSKRDSEGGTIKAKEVPPSGGNGGKGGGSGGGGAPPPPRGGDDKARGCRDDAFFRLVTDEEVPNDLHPVGCISNWTSMERQSHTHLLVSVETFLSDCYRYSPWYLELHNIQDTEAETPRGIFLRATPLGDPAGSTLVRMRIDQEGRIRMPPNYRIVPSGFLGSPPRFFRNRLEQNTVEELFTFLQDHAQGAIIYIQRSQYLEERSWTKEGNTLNNPGR